MISEKVEVKEGERRIGLTDDQTNTVLDLLDFEHTISPRYGPHTNPATEDSKQCIGRKIREWYPDFTSFGYNLDDFWYVDLPEEEE